jgi:hypothetical protein
MELLLARTALECDSGRAEQSRVGQPDRGPPCGPQSWSVLRAWYACGRRAVNQLNAQVSRAQNVGTRNTGRSIRLQRATNFMGQVTIKGGHLSDNQWWSVWSEKLLKSKDRIVTQKEGC